MSSPGEVLKRRKVPIFDDEGDAKRRCVPSSSTPEVISLLSSDDKSGTEESSVSPSQSQTPKRSVPKPTSLETPVKDKKKDNQPGFRTGVAAQSAHRDDFVTVYCSGVVTYDCTEDDDISFEDSFDDEENDGHEEASAIDEEEQQPLWTIDTKPASSMPRSDPIPFLPAAERVSSNLNNGSAPILDPPTTTTEANGEPLPLTQEDDFIPLASQGSETEPPFPDLPLKGLSNPNTSLDGPPPLCQEQADLVETIMQGRNVFYTGSAGCGKSTVLKVFTERFRDAGIHVDIVAPTGRAALEVGGSTTWTYAGWSPESFKLPLAKLQWLAHAKWVRKRLEATDVLVIDEISMVENLHFERLNAIMKEARNNGLPFGGVQLIVTGDFHQLPPVRPFQYCISCGKELIANRSQEMYTCREHGIYHDEEKWAFKSAAWTQCNFKYVELKRIHRQSDRGFIELLQKCRVGSPFTAEETELLINHKSMTVNATKLYSTRNEVREVNQQNFRRLQTETHSYICLDHFLWNAEKHPNLARMRNKLPDGSLTALNDHRYDRKAELKKGMLVVLLANLDLSMGLCNGSQGVVCGYEEFDPARLPKARKKGDDQNPIDTKEIFGDHAEFRETQIRNFIERPEIAKKVWPVVRFHNGLTRTIFADCSLHSLGEEAPYSLLTRTQIPLSAAWAMSIHKSQGLTLDRVIVNLSKAFESGQVYVALSRARNLEGLKVEGDPKGLLVGKGGNAEVLRFRREVFGT